MNIRTVFTVVVLLAAISCTRTKSGEVSGFSAERVEKPSGDQDGTLIVLGKSRLSQQLVWSVWLERVDENIYPGLQPGFSSESMLVFFEVSADQKFVHLFEIKANPLDPRGANLVDRFPVTAIDDQSVTFDFSKGLSKRLFRSFIDPVAVQEFKYSYSSVYDFKNAENVVTFSQLLKLEDVGASTLIMHHAFRLFDDGLGFAPVTVAHPERVGIMPASFSADVTSDEPINIRKWDIRKPIKFYISSNTPKEFQPAIVQGLNWWNQALGTEFIEVEVLSSPVSWGDARINIVQWSEDPTLCAGASAIGPSEANPVTGQIYSGKILFCGRSLFPTYENGVEPGTISRDQYYQKLLTWATAHEMGHVLGYSHNFKGKLYRDPNNDAILNSTVMDYPFPNEIPSYSQVGPADVAKLAVSYLHPGDDHALEALKVFPYCSDEEADYMPDCTRFVPGGLTPNELTSRYLSLLEGDKPLLKMEHGVRGVILKQLLTVGDGAARDAAAKLFRIYPGDKGLLAKELKGLVEAALPAFAKVAPDQQLAVLSTVSDCVLNEECAYSLESRQNLVEAIGKIQNLAAFDTLQDLQVRVNLAIQNSNSTLETEDLYRIEFLIQETLADFWKQTQ
jgi:hypothetical protein